MINTIIICATILIIFSLILIVTKLLVDKNLNIKIDTYKGMDDLHSQELEEIKEHLGIVNEQYHTLINTPYATKEEIEALNGRVNSNQIGQVFSPRRKGK